MLHFTRRSKLWATTSSSSIVLLSLFLFSFFLEFLHLLRATKKIFPRPLFLSFSFRYAFGCALSTTMSIAHKTDKANAKHAPATSASDNFEKRID